MCAHSTLSGETLSGTLTSVSYSNPYSRNSTYVLIQLYALLHLRTYLPHINVCLPVRIASLAPLQSRATSRKPVQNHPRGATGALATPRSVADGSAARRAHGGRIDGGSDG